MFNTLHQNSHVSCSCPNVVIHVVRNNTLKTLIFQISTFHFHYTRDVIEYFPLLASQSPFPLQHLSPSRGVRWKFMKLKNSWKFNFEILMKVDELHLKVENVLSTKMVYHFQLKSCHLNVGWKIDMCR